MKMPEAFSYKKECREILTQIPPLPPHSYQCLH
jgi:hypothetical protein